MAMVQQLALILVTFFLFTLAKVWSHASCACINMKYRRYGPKLQCTNAISWTWHVIIPHALCWKLWYQTYTHITHTSWPSNWTVEGISIFTFQTINFMSVISQIKILTTFNILFFFFFPIFCWWSLAGRFFVQSSGPFLATSYLRWNPLHSNKFWMFLTSFKKLRQHH